MLEPTLVNRITTQLDAIESRVYAERILAQAYRQLVADQHGKQRAGILRDLQHRAWNDPCPQSARLYVETLTTIITRMQHHRKFFSHAQTLQNQLTQYHQFGSPTDYLW